MSQQVVESQEVMESAPEATSERIAERPPVSQAKVDANRANAQKSTGPRTPEGKARVARNAIKHGLLCREAVLDFDDRAEFEDFRQALWLDLKPVGAMEEVLAERIIAGHWRLRRAIHLDSCLMALDESNARFDDVRSDTDNSGPEGSPVSPLSLGHALEESMGGRRSTYETLRRYERTIQRDLEVCFRQLERRQGSRSVRAELAGPAQSHVEEEAQAEEGISNHECRMTNNEVPEHREDGFVSQDSQEGPSAKEAGVGFVSQKAPAAAGDGFVSRGRKSLDEALAGFVSQAAAGG